MHMRAACMCIRRASLRCSCACSTTTGADFRNVHTCELRTAAPRVACHRMAPVGVCLSAVAAQLSIKALVTSCNWTAFCNRTGALVPTRRMGCTVTAKLAIARAINQYWVGINRCAVSWMPHDHTRYAEVHVRRDACAAAAKCACSVGLGVW